MPETLPSLTDLKKILLDAGHLAMQYFNSAALETWDKVGNSPVSEADVAVDEFLKNSLTALLPGSGWLSEEIVDNPVRLDKQHVWIVDPIDGTRSFIKREDGWALSVALISGRRPVLAGIYAPAREALFLAQAKEGATLNGETISVSAVDALEFATMMGDEQGFKSPYWPVPWPDTMRCRPLHAIALRLCEVARGKADTCVTFRAMHEWDVAAADLIIQEAGGILETAEKTVLTYNRAKPVFGNLVASNGLIQKAVHSRVGPGLEAWRNRKKKEKKTQK